MATFLIQKVQSGLLPEMSHPFYDAIPFLNCLEYRKFLHEKDPDWKPDNFIYKSFEELTAFDCLAIIPIGTVEFVNKVLILKGHSELKPLNIPNALMKPEFVKRKVAYVKGKDNVPALFTNWHRPQLFIKSNSKIKADYTDFYYKNHLDKLPEDNYLVSEILPFEAEFRAFVYEDELLDIKQYLGPSSTINKDFVKQCIKEYAVDKSKPKAYTLDIGKVYTIAEKQEDSYAVIELHPFISCGLYDFEDTRMIAMLQAAWAWALKNTEVYNV